ncbi:hypothetical protein M0638_09275 [Roseomonas sp. NAR14]|uniref:Uncharacterized protein n=1 Tax=Roseomonas acroporae TaxID=2937791 RepID=A0A9X2BV07_9PROT|nr:hypothetical protein [Roseomonas acroporae]MCK8784571.1 hypothetical protein [Roseomonas acroporae]
MALRIDARIPVQIVADRAALLDALRAHPGAAILADAPLDPAPAGAATLLVLDPAPPAGLPHPAACACCTGRGPAATALDRLFQARVRGQVPWFTRVLALLPDAEAQAAVDLALYMDPLASSRFRPA